MKMATHPGNVYAHEPRNIAALKAAYPHQFAGAAWQYSWCDGWHRLVVEACAALDRFSDGGQWLQIKEKLGGLRLYYQGGPLRFDLQKKNRLISGALDPDGGPVKPTDLNNLIFSLEAASRQTCALCGGVHGAGRIVNLTGWWIATCETCEPLIRAHRDLPWEDR
jgi:hypothetical protein